MLTTVKVLLPVAQIVVAVILVTLGSKQVPTVVQDSPPFVAPATKLCESINTPATLLVGGLMILAHSSHLEQSLSQTPIPHTVFWGGVALLWFIVGLEGELLLKKRSSARHRLVAACMAITLAVATALFGVTAWQQGEVALTIGFATWSSVLILFYGTDLIRLAVPRSQMGRPPGQLL